MTYVGDNSWSYTLSYDFSAPNQLLEFKILVNDNMWQIGANNAVVLPTSGNAYVSVYPWFVTTNGNYIYIRNIYSPQLNNTRDLVIYYPPSYVENTLKQYSNVLVMHDGQNLFNASTSFAGVAWMCQDTVDALVNQGSMEEIIIVGVDNTADRIDELTYSYDASVGAGGKGDIYLNFIEQTVLPIIYKTFRIDTENLNLGILGSSLGGLISCYAGWTRSNVYNLAGCMSSSFWWNNEDFNGVILQKDSPPKQLEVYLDSGNAGPDNDDEAQTKTVLAHMQTLGFTLGEDLWYYLDKGGQHSEKYWGARFFVPMTDLYPPSNLTVTPL
eukprot:Phypoly_transcript_12904.p1 GENE.Phypoly_transcript_12904~~Phypoly_transcript_12904.p1  ORF type:complete len:355 (+),score=40.19 Phypoly_transcript_12904:86-1066(+)